MKGKMVWLMAGAILVTAALPASATLVRDPWASWLPCDELNLFEIVNALYGTDFGSSADMLYAQLDPNAQTFSGSEGVKATAHYGSWNQTFGWYQYTGSGDPTVHHDLFTVTEEGLGNFGTAEINPVGEYGFYDVVGPCWRPELITWYSEADENPCGEDHMVAYDLQALTHNADYANHFVIGWEDKPFIISDRDYQDLVLELCALGQVDPPIGPEPTTLVLLGMGGVVYALRRLRVR